MCEMPTKINLNLKSYEVQLAQGHFEQISKIVGTRILFDIHKNCLEDPKNSHFGATYFPFFTSNFRF